MGVMIDGVWHATEPKTNGKDGAFKRPETAFRNWITADVICSKPITRGCIK